MRIFIQLFTKINVNLFSETHPMNLGQIGNSMNIMNTLNTGFNKITETR